MIMHIITNHTASAGAETMLSRLVRESKAPALVVSLIGVSDRNRQLAGVQARFTSLGMRSPVQALGALVELSRLIKREKPEVIVCWMYHAMVAGVLAVRMARHSAPVFWNIRQSIEDQEALSSNTRLALKLARWLSPLPAGIIYNSARAHELHRRFGFSDRNVAVIPNGFDLVKDPPPVREKRNVIGIAARLHPQKDHETFFQAAAMLRNQEPDASFAAAGAGLTPDNPALLQALKSSGLPREAIDLRGEVADMDAFYRSIDVLVLSSRTEGFPNVVAEAMSYGKPVVTTDVGDSAATVGETGIVVPPGNPRALAEGMKRMLGLGFEDYAALSEAAQRRIHEHFSLSEVARRYDDFLSGSGQAVPVSLAETI